MNANSPIVGEWIYLAQMDFDVAEREAEVRFRPPIEVVCYHCQQSVEKILKGYITANGDTPVRTHDLTILIDACKQYLPDFGNYARLCNTLTTYASDTRYPPKLSLTDTDMRQALKEAEEILEFTKSKLAEMGFGV